MVYAKGVWYVGRRLFTKKENMRELPVDQVVRIRREGMRERGGDKGERERDGGRWVEHSRFTAPNAKKEPESECRTAAKKANEKQSEK